MKVFLSWSEERSRRAAAAFKGWLEQVLQAAEPWMSPDIEKGAKWPSEIGERLESTYVGVVFLTKENLNSLWLHYEVGALAKTKSGRPCMFLLDVQPTDVKGPLSLYQHTRSDAEDVRKLLQNLRAWAEREDGKVIGQSALDSLFTASWPALDRALREIPPTQAPDPPRGTEDLARGNPGARACSTR
jgi:TIR domain-containing protein